MEPPQTEELPRTPGRISPNLALDDHVQILEFVEEVDIHGHTKSIKQRKKKASKRKRESGQPSETSGKKKRRKIDAEGSQELTEKDQGSMEPEPAQAITEEPPRVPIAALVDYLDEEQCRESMPDETRSEHPIEPTTAGRRDPDSYSKSADSLRAKPEQGTDGGGSENF